MKQPNFEHNCTNCKYLGSIGDVADLYMCEGETIASALIRLSSEPSNYDSKPFFNLKDARREERRALGYERDDSDVDLYLVIKSHPTTFRNLTITGGK